ncbi:hypothetical protein GC173_06640 [bacterium]|nr:hypothetical protein [bacterium]
MDIDLTLPSLTFMGIAYAAAAVLAIAGVASLQGNFRVNGAANWILLFVFAPLPVLVGVPLAGLVALDPYAALPPVAMATILALPWIYLILPSLLPDFQVDSFTSALVPAALVGGGLFIGGLVTQSFPNGLLLGDTDSKAVFEGRSAGLDLSAPNGNEE